MSSHHNLSGEKWGYTLRSLPAHLAEGGQEQRLRQLLTSFSFIKAKMQSFGPQAVISDYDLADSSAGDTLGLIQGALRLAAHILAGDMHQLQGQLIGRLRSYQTAELREFLDQVGQQDRGVWLRPISASLRSPGDPLVVTLAGHSLPIQAVAVMPDDLHAVSASADGTLKIWDIATGAAVLALAGHSDMVNGVAVTPDGQRVVSASSDKTLKVWDARTGSMQRTLRGHVHEVQSVAVLSDGQRAVSGAGSRGSSADVIVQVGDLVT